MKKVLEEGRWEPRKGFARLQLSLQLSEHEGFVSRSNFDEKLDGLGRSRAGGVAGSTVTQQVRQLAHQ
jgi:hypothetical protein